VDQPGLFESIYSTRALRRLRPEPLPEDTLFQLIDAAIRAPSGQNAQDWRFIVITDPDLKRRMREWSVEAWSRYQPKYSADPAALDGLPRTPRLSLRSTGYLAEHLDEAPAIVAVCGLEGRHSSPGGSTFPAIQNLLLAARGLGLGASIFNLPLTHSRELAEALAVPDDYRIACLIPVGHPVDRHGPVARKPVAQVAFRERWGEPWPFAQEQPAEGWAGRWTR